MIVPVVRKRKDFHGDLPKHVICNAHIPLSYLKKISNGAVKLLADHLNVITIEDLYEVPKEAILEKIEGRNVRKEIFEAKDKITKRALVKKHVIKFEDFAMDKNIRISPHQRAFLIAISLFKEILKDIKEVVFYVLGATEDTLPFRQKALLFKLCNVSIRALKVA